MVEAAYAAGVLDSEGSLGVYFSGPTGHAIANVRIGSQDLELLRWMRLRWGGGLYNHGRVHLWQLTRGQLIVDFLAEVQPFVRTKQEQLRNVLAFLEHRADTPPDEFVTRSKELNAALAKDFIHLPKDQCGQKAPIWEQVQKPLWKTLCEEEAEPTTDKRMEPAS
jgi:hypothetical protein